MPYQSGSVPCLQSRFAPSAPSLNFSWVRSLFSGRRPCLLPPVSPGICAFCAGSERTPRRFQYRRALWFFLCLLHFGFNDLLFPGSFSPCL